MTDSPLTRRRILAIGGVVGAAGLGLAGCGTTDPAAEEAAGGASSPTPGTAGTGTCVLTTEATEGPYYLDLNLIRKDITEGKDGARLTLKINVAAVTGACEVIADAAVELWHCDAWGYYSGFTTMNPGGDGPTEDGVGDEGTFLRGIQVSDAQGNVEFTTIVPGWYTPRTAHIHCKVHLGGTVEGEHYEGGETVHTGQFFFEDAIAEALYETDPYSRHSGDYTVLADDMVYTGGGTKDGLLSITGSPAEGYVGTIGVGVDPENVSEENGPGDQPGAP